MKRIKKYSILIVLLLICGNMQAQLLDSVALDSMRTYYSIESAMKNPDKVYKLKLSKKKLAEFPKEILQFKNLNELDLSKNKISIIPMELKQLKYLQKVNLSKNKLRQWPLAVCELPELRELRMSQNMIESFPPTINQLKKLEVLDLWSNDLIYFPQEISELTSLKWMDLRVIQTNKETQLRIESYVPHARVYFDPPCSCAN